MRMKDKGEARQREGWYRLDDKLYVHTRGKANKDQERGYA